MIPIILNTSFEKLAMYENYISFIWTTRYYAPGDFELCLPITEDTVNTIQKDYYIMREDDYNVGIIEAINYQKTEGAADMMIITGRFLSSILGRRIVATMTEINNLTVPNAIKKFITDAIISPAIGARKINNFSFVDNSGFTEKITIQRTGTNLLELVKELCETYGIGFRTLLENGNFVFTLFSGVDRSYNQTANPYVVFSHDYNNLESTDYAEDYTNIVTDVLVAGEGEGTARKTAWASKQTNTGLARYEMYQDARNSSTNNGEISDSVYLEQLREEGLESITTYTTAFAGTVFFQNYEYKKDVNIGDIVTIENNKWGIGINTRIIEVIESTSEAGEYTIIPTFGA